MNREANMNILSNKDILSQIADFTDFSNTIGGGRVGVKFQVTEYDEYKHIEVKAPSVSAENMKVNIEDGALIIAATLSFNREGEENGEFFTKEAKVPYFFRVIPLDQNIDTGDIQAVHEGDTLHIKLTYKNEKRKTWRSIPIRKLDA
ncbi:Hsp20/alpha crystallin family protein [Roseivirga sp. BDSF3-8]|uniref:Hsp20/alpha crystallin family protein n=1 Tax=Roseivirga sp. BDSF3-8 TaxID=3241598 RepID=UPI00353231DE